MLIHRSRLVFAVGKLFMRLVYILWVIGRGRIFYGLVFGLWRFRARSPIPRCRFARKQHPIVRSTLLAVFAFAKAFPYETVSHEAADIGVDASRRAGGFLGDCLGFQPAITVGVAGVIGDRDEDELRPRRQVLVERPCDGLDAHADPT